MTDTITLWNLRPDPDAILNKRNLVKSNWHVNKNASPLVQFSQLSSLQKSSMNSRVLLINWLRGMSRNLKSYLLVGAAALCRAFWLCRNVIFWFKKKICPHWLSTRVRVFGRHAPKLNGRPEWYSPSMARSVLIHSFFKKKTRQKIYHFH
jgi:hypothetical protein